MQYQFLQTNITRAVWQTGRRITNEILGVKSLIIIAYSQGAIIWNGFCIIAAIIKLSVCTSQRSASFSLSVGFVVCFTRGCCHFHPFGLFTALCYEIKQKNGSYSCTSSPSFPSILSAPVCRKIYIMRVEYRNLSVSTIKHNDVIRALKQKSYHIVLAPVVRSPE